MSQNTTLSRSARLFCYLGPPSVILVTAIASPKTALISPIAFLPSVGALETWRTANKAEPSRRARLEPLIWTYALIGTVGLATVGVVQMGALKLIDPLLFGAGELRKDYWKEFVRSSVDGLTINELARRAELSKSWQNWVFNGVLSFALAGACEEILKYLPVVYARRREQKQQKVVEEKANPETPAKQPPSRAYLDYALAGALSFGVIENIGFIYVSCAPGLESWSKLIGTLAERITVGATGHALLASITALRATRRDHYGGKISLWRLLAPAAILHGAWDFWAFSLSTLQGNVGWIHPTDFKSNAALFSGAALIFSIEGWLITRELKKLEDLERRSK
ncbi:hypothetical protein BJ875DRAFT_450787 [Amylocarpus encephaloides]|uniref:PrsW family intramembrane metalloprotease n=1 Tax=Amylocarpus encephaloides TaxID=45428 RepID=A0A9P7YRM0_9HELO|nr:hypothetical protein BJ875DRAFT_450787 [Amylocarpus encephaloides]